MNNISDPLLIAVEELKAKKIPITIRCVARSCTSTGSGSMFGERSSCLTDQFVSSFGCVRLLVAADAICRMEAMRYVPLLLRDTLGIPGDGASRLRGEGADKFARYLVVSC